MATRPTAIARRTYGHKGFVSTGVLVTLEISDASDESSFS